MAAEATIETDATPDPEALREFAAKLDRANMKKIGAFHFALVMGALTLWGAGVAWAQVTGWVIAEVAAVANEYLTSNVPSRRLTTQKEPASTALVGEHMQGLLASQTMSVPEGVDAVA